MEQIKKIFCEQRIMKIQDNKQHGVARSFKFKDLGKYDIIKELMPHTYEKMAKLKDSHLMKCRISHDQQKTIWSGVGIIYSHVHFHTDQNNTRDAVSLLRVHSPDDKATNHHVIVVVRMDEILNENLSSYFIGLIFQK